jgi:hypothetical protein
MKSNALDAINYAIEQITRIEGKNYRFQEDSSSYIFGGDDGLDSLNFAFFVVNIEEYIKSKLTVEIVLFDDYVFGLDPQDPKHPFANVENLVSFIEEKVKLAKE